MKFFSRFLQVGGVLFFVVIVLGTVFFVEGYQYNSAGRDFVKKAVIYFEGSMSEYAVLIDGKATDVSFPREIRTLPGVHDIELRRDGYETWKKRLTVPEDAVVRFRDIQLLPANIQTRQQKLIKTLEPNNNLSVQSISEHAFFAANSQLHFGKQYTALQSSASFAIFEFLSNSSFIKIVPFEDHLVALAPDHSVFFIDEKGRMSRLPDQRALDIMAGNEHIYMLDAKSGVWRISDSKTPSRFIFGIDPMQKMLQKIVRVQETPQYTVISFETQNGERITSVIQSDGTVIFQDCCIESAFLEDTVLYYTTGAQYHVYDMSEHKLLHTYTLTKPVQWMSRVGDTFHFLFLTKDLELLFCDEDMGNCRSIITLSAPLIAASEDRFSFLAIYKGNFVRINFRNR